MGDVLRFNARDPYSNFYPRRIKLDGKWYATVEHYFQACKAANRADHERVRSTDTPAAARRLGRRIKLRKDWESIKEAVMHRGVLAKFEQHADLRQALLETTPRPLVEYAPWDSYWGDGGDGRGQNRLGKILMQVRECFLNQLRRSSHERA